MKGVTIMRKVYKLENLDCANCAAKMETAINKLDGVESASVNFMTQKLTIYTEDSLLDDVVEQVGKIIKKIEPDCVIVA